MYLASLSIIGGVSGIMSKEANLGGQGRDEVMRKFLDSQAAGSRMRALKRHATRSPCANSCIIFSRALDRLQREYVALRAW